MRRRILNAASAATLAALGFARWDAISLEELSVPHRVGVGLTAIALLVEVLAAALLSGLVFMVIRAPLSRWYEVWKAEPPKAGARFLWLCTGWVLATATALVVVWLCQLRGIAEPSARLAVSFSVVVVAAAWIGTRPDAEPWLAQRLRRAPWLGIAVSAGLTIALFSTLSYVAIPILEQLELRPLITWLCVALGAGLGAAIPPSALVRTPVRRVTLALRGAAALVLCGAVISIGVAMTSKKPSRLDLALELRATSTAWLIKWMRPGRHERILPLVTHADRSAVCTPERQAPRLEDVTFSPSDVDIVFITVDALRWDHTSLAGYARDTTPMLARYAEEAAVFERAYSVSGTTRQTFRALFTGVYPSSVHEVRGAMRWGLGLADAQITLAEYLRHAGYETIAFSAIEGIMSSRHGALDGFDEIDESASPMLRKYIPTSGYLINQVVERLRAPRAGKPRFVWTHLMAPHHPYPAGPNPVRYGEELVDRYDAAIHFADAELGKLLEFVRAPERAAHTWIVITADHGEEFYEHRGQGHGEPLFEEHVHVPLLVWGPDLVPKRHRERISQIHLVKTILELGGVTPPDALCGKSLVPTLREGTSPPVEPIYMEVLPDFGRSHFRSVLIRGDLKTTVLPSSGARMLFDLAADPGETRDLAIERPDLLKEELEAIRTLHIRHGRNLEAYGL